ncbi:MAG: tetraacyldisaccharide 4'-kinase, partial [Candidatus Hydrogenedentes bacterium]|nr:tetraacyldisaccharide 4'-kinase [Candidatus Hydrogenedentota bacterium]
MGKELDRLRERNIGWPSPLDYLLGVGTPLVRLGMWWRLRGPRTRVEARVISLGNLTAGGTGKTPAVIARAQAEIAAGRRVAVLTRGYGSQRVREPYVLPPGTPLPETPLYKLIGDEPALIRRRAPGITLVKSADRVAGAHAAIAAGCDTILLDDGFQAVALERDENILLVDATNAFGNGHLLPRGILREPVAAAGRATEIILTRCDQV